MTWFAKKRCHCCSPCGLLPAQIDLTVTDVSSCASCCYNAGFAGSGNTRSFRFVSLPEINGSYVLNQQANCTTYTLSFSTTSGIEHWRNFFCSEPSNQAESDNAVITITATVQGNIFSTLDQQYWTVQIRMNWESEAFFGKPVTLFHVAPFFIGDGTAQTGLPLTNTTDCLICEDEPTQNGQPLVLATGGTVTVELPI